MASFFLRVFLKVTIVAFVILIFQCIISYQLLYIPLLFVCYLIKYLSLKMIIFSNNLSLEIKIFIEKCFRIEFTEGCYDKMKKKNT